MQIGDDRVRKSTAQNLRVEYEQINFKDGESVEDFALHLSNIVQRLAILGDPEPEAKVFAKYLRVARPRYKLLVVSIELLLDISTLSIEEITGRLKAGKDDGDLGSKARLNHIEDELVDRVMCHGSSSLAEGRPAAGALRHPTRSVGAAVAHPRRGAAAVAKPGVQEAEAPPSSPPAGPTRARRNSPVTSARTAARLGIGPANVARRSGTSRRMQLRPRRKLR